MAYLMMQNLLWRSRLSTALVLLKSIPFLLRPTMPEAFPPLKPTIHVFSTWLRPSPTHPHLRRTLLHTYRGRPLIEDNSTGETKFLDESAIFVGRLNKRMETYATLYKRFEKYGKIVSDQYKVCLSCKLTVHTKVLYGV